MFSAHRNASAARGADSRRPQHDVSPELGDVPVASYHGRFSPPSAFDVVTSQSRSDRQAGPSQLPAESSSSTSSPTRLLQGSPASDTSETRSGLSNRMDLPSSSSHSSLTSTTIDGASLAQRTVDWEDVRFRNLTLPRAPFPVPAPLSGECSVSPAASGASATEVSDDVYRGRQNRAPSPDQRRTVDANAKKRGREDESPAPDRRRTERSMQDVQNADGTRGSNCFEHLQADRLPHASSALPRRSRLTASTRARAARPQVRPSTLDQVVSQDDHVNPTATIASPIRPLLPAAAGALVDEDKEVGAAPQHSRLAPGCGASSHAQGQHVSSDMNRLLRADSVNSPSTFRFDVHTPRQTRTMLAHSLLDLSVGHPRPQSRGGSLDGYARPRRPDTLLGQDEHLPPFADIERHADGARGYDASTIRQPRRPLADITPVDHPIDDNQENVPPPLPRERSTGFSILRGRTRAREFSGPREGSGSFFSSLDHVTSGTVLHPSALPPGAASTPPTSASRPRAAPPGSIPVGHRELHNVPTRPPSLTRLRAPQGGWPRTYFDDHDSLVSGCDEAFVRMTRTEKLKFQDEGPPLVAHFVLPEGLPPGEISKTALDHAHRAISEITGEKRFWIVPPLVTRNPVYDASVLAVAWFVRGLSNRGAALMLNVRVVTIPSVTFFLFPHTVEPRLCLMLGGFWAPTASHMEERIRATFFGPDIFAVISQCVSASPLFKGVSTLRAVGCLLETLVVKVSTTPRGVRFACAYLTFPGVEPALWRYLRASIATVPFKDGYNRQAVPLRCRCGVCGGNDHPDEMCVWPSLEGWMGPVPNLQPAGQGRTAQTGSMIGARRPELSRDAHAGGVNQQSRNHTGPRFAPGDGPPFSVDNDDGRHQRHDSGAAGSSRTG